MANIKKIKKAQVYNLLKHNNRTQNDGVQHANENIDKELTPYNYHFKKGSFDSYKEIRDANYNLDRDDQVSCLDIVVTLPRDVKEEDESKFFDSCYRFFAKDFGEENVINAVVHKDEITPHLHIDIVPVVKRSEKEATFTPLMKTRVENWEQENGKRCEGIICCKDLITRDYLKTMHKRLLNHVTNDLGYETEILNGATAGGNKSVLELKNGLLEDEISEKEEQVKILNKNISFLLNIAQEHDIDMKSFDMMGLLDELSLAKQEVSIYKEELLRHGIEKVSLPESFLEEKRKSRFVGSNFTVCGGILIPNPETVTLLEIPKEIARPYPVMRLVRNNPSLKAILEERRFMEMTKVQCGDNPYLLFPTDNEEDTFHNLIRLKKQKDIKKLAMVEVTNDEYNLAESVLRKCDFEVNYYLLKNEEANEREREQKVMQMLGIG